MSMFTREDTGLEQVAAVEGEIREFVRRDAANLRRQPDEGKAVADNISTLRLRPWRRRACPGSARCCSGCR